MSYLIWHSLCLFLFVTHSTTLAAGLGSRLWDLAWGHWWIVFQVLCLHCTTSRESIQQTVFVRPRKLVPSETRLTAAAAGQGSLDLAFNLPYLLAWLVWYEAILALEYKNRSRIVFIFTFFFYIYIFFLSCCILFLRNRLIPWQRRCSAVVRPSRKQGDQVIVGRNCTRALISPTDGKEAHSFSWRWGLDGWGYGRWQQLCLSSWSLPSEIRAGAQIFASSSIG